MGQFIGEKPRDYFEHGGDKEGWQKSWRYFHALMSVRVPEVADIQESARHLGVLTSVAAHFAVGKCGTLEHEKAFGSLYFRLYFVRCRVLGILANAPPAPLAGSATLQSHGFIMQDQQDCLAGLAREWHVKNKPPTPERKRALIEVIRSSEVAAAAKVYSLLTGAHADGLFRQCAELSGNDWGDIG